MESNREDTNNQRESAEDDLDQALSRQMAGINVDEDE